MRPPEEEEAPAAGREVLERSGSECSGARGRMKDWPGEELGRAVADRLGKKFPPPFPAITFDSVERLVNLDEGGMPSGPSLSSSSSPDARTDLAAAIVLLRAKVKERASEKVGVRCSDAVGGGAVAERYSPTLCFRPADHRPS